MTYAELTELLADARPDEWLHDDYESVWTLTRDLDVTIRERRREEDLGTLNEPWAARLGHDPVHVYIFDLWYGASLVKAFHFASVDGIRALLPYPKSPEVLAITREQLSVAVAVNSHLGRLNEYLERAGIRVSE